jgi:hypothetical protein
MSSAKRARALSALRPLKSALAKTRAPEAGLLLGDVVVQALGPEGLLGREELQGPGPDEGPFLVLYVARLEAEAVLVVHQDPPLGQGGDPGVQVDPLGTGGLHAEGGEAGRQGQGKKEGKGKKPHDPHYTPAF